MVNIGTRVEPVNIAFSSSRNATLNERKVLQYTTFIYKTPSFYFEREVKTQVSTSTDVLACLSIHCVDKKQQSNRDTGTF